MATELNGEIKNDKNDVLNVLRNPVRKSNDGETKYFTVGISIKRENNGDVIKAYDVLIKRVYEKIHGEKLNDVEKLDKKQFLTDVFFHVIK